MPCPLCDGTCDDASLDGLVTHASAAGDAPAADEPGLFDHYLQKPIDFDALDRILATVQGNQ